MVASARSFTQPERQPFNVVVFIVVTQSGTALGCCFCWDAAFAISVFMFFFFLWKVDYFAVIIKEGLLGLQGGFFVFLFCYDHTKKTIHFTTHGGYVYNSPSVARLF